MIPPRELTTDGFESQLGVNHLGHFALTHLVLPKILESKNSRIISVSSSAHKFGSIDFDDLYAERSYSRNGRYAMSKLANLLFTYELDRRLAKQGSSTIALACHPGVSDTDLSRHLPNWLLVMRPILKYLIPNQAPKNGALPTLRAAVDPAAKGGDYFGPSRLNEIFGPPIKVKSNAKSHDRNVAERLWQVSLKTTSVEDATLLSNVREKKKVVQ